MPIAKFLPPLWLTTMVLVALAVQVLVWGTAAPRGGGSLLPFLRPMAGVGYAAGMLAAAVLYCLVYHLARGVAWVLTAAATVDLVVWCGRLAGAGPPVGAAASLTAAAGIVALAAGVLSGRLDTRAHPRREDRSGRANAP